MISDEEVRAYHRDGVIIVPEVLGAETLAHLRRVVAELVAGAAAVTEHTDVYDLEPAHTPQAPRVRRIKAPHKVHPVFDAVVRSQPVHEILTKLIGPGLRLHGSKLNMKSANMARRSNGTRIGPSTRTPMTTFWRSACCWTTPTWTTARCWSRRARIAARYGATMGRTAGSSG